MRQFFHTWDWSRIKSFLPQKRTKKKISAFKSYKSHNIFERTHQSWTENLQDLTPSRENKKIEPSPNKIVEKRHYSILTKWNLLTPNVAPAHWRNDHILEFTFWNMRIYTMRWAQSGKIHSHRAIQVTSPFRNLIWEILHISSLEVERVTFCLDLNGDLHWT